MSIYDKASLVLIPSGTKTSKVYSQKPTNGDGDFTFSRSTAATRVNASGNIEKETQNLLLQSNTFDTTWTPASTSVTGGFLGYDGTLNAWELSKSNSSAFLRQAIVVTGVHTISVYAKADSLNWMRIGVSNSPIISCYFDIANGAIGTKSNEIDAEITSVGSGWYRCSVSYYAASHTGLQFYPADGDNDLSGTSGSIYIQDAQLEYGQVARDYIETTTAAVEGGITDNVPRLDYTDSSCPALLLEPQRTNYAAISEYFDHIDWAKSGSPSVVVNSERSPELLQNACTLTSTASGDRIQLSRQNLANDVTYSIYAKSTGSYTKFRMRDSGSGNDARFHIDANGTITYDTGTNDGYTINEHGNGWYRLSFTFRGAAGTSLMQLFPDFTNGGGSVYVYGAQMEQGSYATSYIPTHQSTVTRNQDGNLQLNDLITKSIGTSGGYSILFELDQNENPSGSNSVVLSIGKDASMSSVELSVSSYEQAAAGRLRIVGATDGTIEYLDSPNTRKYAFAVNNTTITWADENESGTDTTSVSANSIGSIRAQYGTSERTISFWKQLIIVPSVLTAQEMYDWCTQ